MTRKADYLTRGYGGTARRRRRLARASATRPPPCAARFASSRKPTRTCRTRRSARSRRTRRCGAGWGSSPRTSSGASRRRRDPPGRRVPVSRMRAFAAPNSVTRKPKRRSLQRSGGSFDRFPLCPSMMTSRRRRRRRLLVLSRKKTTFGPGYGWARSAPRGGGRAAARGVATRDAVVDARVFFLKRRDHDRRGDDDAETLDVQRAFSESRFPSRAMRGCARSQRRAAPRDSETRDSENALDVSSPRRSEFSAVSRLSRGNALRV